MTHKVNHGTIYLVGGAPRAGKSILAQRVSARLEIGWVSTDLLVSMLAAMGEERPNARWNADPEDIQGAADWFFPAWSALSLVYPRWLRVT